MRFSGLLGRYAGSYEALVEEGQDCRWHMRLHAYDSESYQLHENVALAELGELLPGPGVRWLEVGGFCNLPLMQALVERFQIHPLAMEDVMNPDVRPKVEEHDDLLQVCAKLPHGESGALRSTHFSLLLTPSLLISFSASPDSHFSRVSERLAAKSSRTRRRGADFLAHVLLDVVVDHFILAAKGFEDELDALQEEDADPEHVLLRSGELKKRVVSLRRDALAMQVMTLDLKDMDSELIGKGLRPYLRDLHDHASFVLDSLERSQETLSELQQLQLALISQRMNDIMRVLTMVATVFIPLTFVTGLYGMNVDLPPLLQDLGFPGALLLMSVMALLMIALFRRKGWL